MQRLASISFIKILPRHEDKKNLWEVLKNGRVTLNLCNEVYWIFFVVTKWPEFTYKNCSCKEFSCQFPGAEVLLGWNNGSLIESIWAHFSGRGEELLGRYATLGFQGITPWQHGLLLYVKDHLDFSFVFSGPLPAWRNTSLRHRYQITEGPVLRPPISYTFHFRSWWFLLGVL
jgi:hypothetical protein